MKLRSYLRAVVVLAIASMLAVLFVLVPRADVAFAWDDPGITFDVKNTLKEDMNTDGAKTIYFGGNNAHSWKVIGMDGEGAAPKDGAITLIKDGTIGRWKWAESDNCLVEYDGSDIRQWMNMNVGDYPDVELAAMIKRSDIYDDPLWLFSREEAEKIDVELRRTDGNSWRPDSMWWLRDTTYDDICRALVVKGDGSFDDTGYSICYEDGFGVRPGFHLNESKVLFLSSAIDGKDSGGEGADELAAVKDNSYGLWKLTLKDDAREGFDAKVSDTEAEAHSWIEVDYSGAVTGDDEYLSALIMDKDGDVTYYGRIKALANEADKSGSVKINLEGKRNDGDSLYVFNEHCSGDYKTDWSSALKKMTIEDSQTGDVPGARDIEPPDNNWHEPVMNPGDTYDCTDAGWNTSVYIKKAGSYTIKGQSNNVRVMIESTGVKLYLADGLNLNCGATTYVGSRTAAINIMLDSGEKDGWVSIISKKNASAYLEGYMAPGIEKDDTKTQLIFDTEDTKNPGTITAKGGLVSAGIGSIDYLPEKTGTTGNMFFNAGNIKAYGGAEAFGYQGSGAGIGGGYAGHVDEITINGGDIYAMAGYDAAAIGGGCLGKVNNLVINGGTVYADSDKEYAGTAAAIGSGGGAYYEYRNHANNIIINGGSVTAEGHGSVCIGAGGAYGPVMDILKITGGTIKCDSKNNTVCTGIGAAEDGTVNSLVITGGVISATGSNGAPAIGAAGDGFASEQVLSAQISGGTIAASGGEYDIGMNPNVPSGNVAVTITGGSIIADKIENAQGDGRQAAHKVEIGFDGMGDNGKAVTDAVFSEPNFKYGTNDVWTENGGKVYFWLPSVDFELQSLNVNGNKYEGSIKASDTSGTLALAAPEPPNNVVKLSATIKASPKTVKKGKKTTVKVTSNSGAKLKAAASNKKAKQALKKKFVKIKNGKTVKITFTKKAPKGKYKFKVTSPAKGGYEKTVKTVTIKVK